MRPFSYHPPNVHPPLSPLGLELQTQQSKAQDASCLPALKVSDIEPRIPFTELAVTLAGQCDRSQAWCSGPWVKSQEWHWVCVFVINRGIVPVTLVLLSVSA